MAGRPTTVANSSTSIGRGNYCHGSGETGERQNATDLKDGVNGVRRRDTTIFPHQFPSSITRRPPSSTSTPRYISLLSPQSRIISHDFVSTITLFVHPFPSILLKNVTRRPLYPRKFHDAAAGGRITMIHGVSRASLFLAFHEEYFHGN